MLHYVCMAYMSLLMPYCPVFDDVGRESGAGVVQGGQHGLYVQPCEHDNTTAEARRNTSKAMQGGPGCNAVCQKVASAYL